MATASPSRDIARLPAGANLPCFNLGQRIRQLRAQQGITQEELADRSGLFRTYLSRIERGTANPTITMLYALAAALDVEVRQLFASAGRSTEVSRVRSRVPTPARGRISR